MDKMKRFTTRRNLAYAFALIGLITSLYLYAIKVTANKAMCLPGIGDCWTVNNSIYSEFMGIPVSLIGAAGYLGIIATLWLDSRYTVWRKYSLYLLFAMTFFGVVVSGLLTYVELFVIYAVCPFCVLSAVMMVGLFILALIPLAQSRKEF